MSTKIYNGYRMKALNQRELLTFVKEFKEIVTEKYKERYLNLVADKVTELVDYLAMADADKKFTKIDEMLLSYYQDSSINPRYMINNKKKFISGEAKPDLKIAQKYFLNSPYSRIKTVAADIVENIAKEAEILPTIMNSEYDMEATLVLFPLTSKQTLFMTYSDEFTRLIDKMLGAKDNEFIQKYEIKEYHYQNQTDRPKNISVREWSMRKKNWNKALITSVPADDGISVELVTLRSLYAPLFLLNENIMPYILSKDVRTYKYAWNNIFDEYWAKYKEKHDISDLNFSDVSKADKEFKELIKNKESAEYEAVKAEQERLNDIIPEINENMLKTAIADLVPNYAKHNNIVTS